MILYGVIPGHIYSENDNDLHYIAGHALARLYRLPPGTWRITDEFGCYGLIALTPRYHYEDYERIARNLEEDRERLYQPRS